MAQSRINPVEVIFIAMTSGNSVNKKFPNYFELKYKSDPNKLLINAIENEYIIREVNFEKGIKKLKVNEIKEILEKSTLSISGNKNQLIERILREVPKVKLRKILSNEEFQITEKGEEFLKENDFAVLYHKVRTLSNFISIDEYYNLCLEKSSFSAKKIIENYLSERARKFAINQEWKVYRNMMVTLFEITGKVEYKCHICFVELNFLGCLGTKSVPTEDEISEFLELFTYVAKPLSYQSPVYSIDESREIIVTASVNGIGAIADKITECNFNRDSNISEEKVIKQHYVPSYSGPREFNPLFLEGKFNRGLSFSQMTVIVVALIIIVIFLFVSFNMKLYGLNIG